MVTQSELKFVDNARYNWPWPASKHRSTYQEGDTVRIARIPFNGFTTEEIIGHWGRVIDVDSEGAPFMWLLEFKCYVCEGIHTMNEDEMDLVHSVDLALLEDKAGVLPDQPDPKLAAKRELNNLMAFYLHEAGFGHISVKSHTGLQFNGQKPKWRLIARMMSSGLANLNQLLESLTGAVHRAGGVVEEFQLASPAGFVSVNEEDLDALALDLPLQVIFRCD